jgi:hypothetical protein
VKRATIYFDDDIHKVLKMKSAEISTPMSELVNDAVRAALSEDAEDLASFRERANESAIDFESFVSKLKKNGKL